jgi:shikimate kinase
MKAPNLFLVGPMAAGKSTVGRRLAQHLDYRFQDCDRQLEERTGVDIPLIFELEGEAGFRAREKALLDELTQQQGIVLATGGGAVLDPDNRACLMGRGFVVYLCTSVEEQLRRTHRDHKRPLLQTSDRRARLEALKAERDPLYEQVADYTVSTDSRHMQRVVQSITRRFKEQFDNEV